MTCCRMSAGQAWGFSSSIAASWRSQSATSGGSTGAFGAKAASRDGRRGGTRRVAAIAPGGEELRRDVLAVEPDRAAAVTIEIGAAIGPRCRALHFRLDYAPVGVRGCGAAPCYLAGAVGLIAIRLRCTITTHLKDQGLTTSAAIGAATALPAAESVRLLTHRQWRAGDVAALQAVADRLELQVVPPDTSLLTGVERAYALK